MKELNLVKEVSFGNKEENRIWENWAKYSLRSGEELLNIVYGPFREEFQKMALFLLLAPDTAFAPFYWKGRELFHFLYTEVDFKKVETGLRAHAAYWLTKFIDFTKSHWDDCDHKTVLLDAYNKYILQLLFVLPVEDNQAETLFQYFSINDIAFWFVNHQNSSGYNPLLALWKNHQINERWKRIADAEMRRVIKEERRGEREPRQSYEDALRCYVKHLQSLLLKHSFPYSKDFLADQISFLISLEVYDQYLIQPESIGLLLNLLADEKYGDLRQRLIRFAVLRDNNFKVNDEQTEKSALTILADCDGQVAEIVKTCLAVYHTDQQSQKEKREEVQKINEALLAPMRRPADLPPCQNQSEQ